MGSLRGRATFAGVTTARRTTAQTFEARGKLMLTGEYLVLDGASALAVPTVVGQRLRVSATEDVDVLLWRSYDRHGACWLEEAFSRRRIQLPPDRSDTSPAGRLARLLHGALETHPLLWPVGTGLSLEATLEFDRTWGLGSSATLVYLIAAWAGADAYALNREEFGGSGYDIACAGASGPLVYRLADDAARTPVIRALDGAPAWLGEAWLVHLGAKRDSRSAIADYRRPAGPDLARYVAEADGLTEALLAAEDAATAAELLRRHEALIGYVTHQRPVGRARFADFPGVVKSLGAWGGDFALALPTAGCAVAEYFAQHGLTTVVAARDLLDLGPAKAIALQPVPDPSWWPVFLYGELATTDAGRDWAAGYPSREAALVDFVAADDALEAPIPQPGGRLAGLLVALPPDDLVALDLHPLGRGFRRSHATVEVDGGRVRAMVWV